MEVLLAGRLTGNNSMEHTSPCSDACSVDKENTSGNRVELSVERQHMKKNAGFNLLGTEPFQLKKESSALDSNLYGHNLDCDGQAVSETEKGTVVSESTETNCEASSVGPFPNFKDWFRESEEEHLSSCQIVLEGKEASREMDVLTRNERADTDETGSSDVEQNTKHVKLLLPDGG
ncbi:hypothetical protein Bca52824_022623 [Brassica carinata]|uniref:Uncharacterized protein n=1 Tax=Brassica carinata TaxID=52824 RepID=A0A8X7VGW2_BRACI|nr:hypothetical protein Bca52824_022623 [Brassica carinata]